MRRLALLAFVVGCGSASPDLPRPIVAVRPVPAPVASIEPQQEIAPQRDEMLDWVREKLPEGGSVTRDEHGAILVTHKAGPRESLGSVAYKYLALSSTYLAEEFAKHIATVNAIPMWDPSVAGKTITIPDIVAEPYKSPEEERLGWPEDRALRAIFLRGFDALGTWETTLDRLKARDMNAVILDAKAYMGELTYPSKIEVAVRTNASEGAPIRDLARTIRFAHQRGVRVSMRVACFHDPLSAKRAPELSIKGTWGGPYPVGWLDPGDAAAQQYIADIVTEVIEMGADEINLDYVRYPVDGGLGNADFHLKDTHRTRVGVITDFVKKIHAITQAHHVPLSLDIFGVTATGQQIDIDNLGQDIGKLAPNAEALMPMVYPSHYGRGYMGWAEPGNHPEIIAIGTKAAIAREKGGGAVGGSAGGGTPLAIIRPWLQAFNYKSPEYSPKYLAQETVEAQRGGGVGYAMWNPGGWYGDAWTAIPAKTQQ
jgi:hypothetical protein